MSPVLPAGGVAVDNQKTQWDSVLAGGESAVTREIRFTAANSLFIRAGIISFSFSSGLLLYEFMTEVFTAHVAPLPLSVVYIYLRPQM